MKNTFTVNILERSLLFFALGFTMGGLSEMRKNDSDLPNLPPVSTEGYRLLANKLTEQFAADDQEASNG